MLIQQGENHKIQNVNEKIILYVLVLLALSNLIFLIFTSNSGPVVGFAVAVGATIHWWIRRKAGFMIAIALIWIFLHIYELIGLGAGPYPILFFLNLLLPLPLLYCSLRAYLSAKKEVRKND